MIVKKYWHKSSGIDYTCWQGYFSLGLFLCILSRSNV